MTTNNQCMQLLYEYGLLKNTVIALHPTIHSQYVIRLALKKNQTKKKPAPLVIQIKIHILYIQHAFRQCFLHCQMTN